MIGWLRARRMQRQRVLRLKRSGRTWVTEASPITLASRATCTGCGACQQICPKQALSMEPDEEGFLRPALRLSSCVQCHQCEKVCPVLHPGQPDPAPKVYGGRTLDEDLRLKSSSGGLFTELARPILAKGGIVFGCVWEDGDPHRGAILTHTETEAQLAAMRGSKYLQAETRNTYQEAKEALESGREVFFTGTSCQIAGLKAFLRKPYPNLLTVEVICHGTPSPDVWKHYLETFGKRVVVADFRDKTHGGTWQRPSVYLSFADGTDLLEDFWHNRYIQAFLGEMCSRPSCYACAFRSGASGADLTIADLWGAQEMLPDLDDDTGLSLIVVHTPRGVEALPSTLLLRPVEAEIAFAHNMYHRSAECPPRRDWFMRHFAFGSFTHAVRYAENGKKRKLFRYYLTVLFGRR